LTGVESGLLGLLHNAGDGGLVDAWQERLESCEFLGEKGGVAAEEGGDAGDGSRGVATRCTGSTRGRRSGRISMKDEL
jgi:hypothetical protein